MIDEKSCCFTGYRPEKFPFELGSKTKENTEFENRLTAAVFSLPKEGCTTFYSGVAMGFDLIAAETVLMLKKSRIKTAVRLICAVPFIEQAKSFPYEWKERYEAVLAEADETVLISDKYYRGCYSRRNKFMVDSSDFVITWFDGRSGGTKNTVEYAQKSGKSVINLFEDTQAGIFLPDSSGKYPIYIAEK